MTEIERIERLEEVLRTLIAWIAQSANSPIAYGEATHLLGRLYTELPTQTR